MSYLLPLHDRLRDAVQGQHRAGQHAGIAGAGRRLRQRPVHGQDPLQLKLQSKKEYAIEFRAEGYQPRVYNISNKVGAGWVVLDVILGLVPVIVDAVTGAWYKLDQNNIDAVLIKQQP